MVADNLFSTPKTVYAAVHKHNNQKGFRAVQEAKAKNRLSSPALTLDKEILSPQ
jgi:hypothetical protein